MKKSDKKTQSNYSKKMKKKQNAIPDLGWHRAVIIQIIDIGLQPDTRKNILFKKRRGIIASPSAKFLFTFQLADGSKVEYQVNRKIQSNSHLKKIFKACNRTGSITYLLGMQVDLHLHGTKKFQKVIKVANVSEKSSLQSAIINFASSTYQNGTDAFPYKNLSKSASFALERRKDKKPQTFNPQLVAA